MQPLSTPVHIPCTSFNTLWDPTHIILKTPQFPFCPFTHHLSVSVSILLNGPLIPFKELFYLHVSVMSLSPHERSQETKKYFVFNTLSSIFIGYILSRFKYIRKLKPKKKCIHGLDGACSFFFFSHFLVFSFLLFFSIFIMYLLSSIFFCILKVLFKDSIRFSVF